MGLFCWCGARRDGGERELRRRRDRPVIRPATLCRRVGGGYMGPWSAQGEGLHEH